MYNIGMIQKHYQQWCDGNEEYRRRWYDFVELAAKDNNTTVESMMNELKQQRWFEWGDR